MPAGRLSALPSKCGRGQDNRTRPGSVCTKPTEIAGGRKACGQVALDALRRSTQIQRAPAQRGHVSIEKVLAQRREQVIRRLCASSPLLSVGQKCHSCGEYDLASVSELRSADGSTSRPRDMMPCPFCQFHYARPSRRRWYERWFTWFTDKRRYRCYQCRRRFWADPQE